MLLLLDDRAALAIRAVLAFWQNGAARAPLALTVNSSEMPILPRLRIRRRF